MKKFIEQKKFINKKTEYTKPKIEIVKFSASSTTVLGNCSGWKQSVVLPYA
ncbi:hypothetical protein [Proteiniborus sp. MB09-C3]|uniref:hypothetical protein n=1 Tax=Proteiniborus sp. MB09-C3 TaxID=3050072 RepID=UPI0025574963|nr:hypothetical protein [Proteiniborus sp. MB09-C3]WIV11344.1 hypothetical protein QO263_14460 [Proteiniborus sp. MB09-C3]